MVQVGPVMLQLAGKIAGPLLSTLTLSSQRRLQRVDLILHGGFTLARGFFSRLHLLAEFEGYGLAKLICAASQSIDLVEKSLLLGYYCKLLLRGAPSQMMHLVAQRLQLSGRQKLHLFGVLLLPACTGAQQTESLLCHLGPLLSGFQVRLCLLIGSTFDSLSKRFLVLETLQQVFELRFQSCDSLTRLTAFLLHLGTAVLLTIAKQLSLCEPPLALLLLLQHTSLADRFYCFNFLDNVLRLLIYGPLSRGHARLQGVDFLLEPLHLLLL